MSRTRSRKSAEQPISFRATLLQPALSAENGNKSKSGGGDWTFLKLPAAASAKLPSRSRVSVKGVINETDFQATLEPDGEGGHWLKVDRKLRQAAAINPGDTVALEVTPVARTDEPEPEVPADLRKALAAAPAKARDVWTDITPIARRDWVHWVISAKQEQTRARRISTACDMLAKGKRRPCCFDRSGMYGKSMSCPTPLAT
jgi:hypothetical protein